MDRDQLQKHTLHLYEGDYERLRSYYPDIGAAVIVRKLVRSFLKKLDKRANPEPAPPVEIEETHHV